MPVKTHYNQPADLISHLICLQKYIPNAQVLGMQILWNVQVNWCNKIFYYLIFINSNPNTFFTICRIQNATATISSKITSTGDANSIFVPSILKLHSEGYVNITTYAGWFLGD